MMFRARSRVSKMNIQPLGSGVARRAATWAEVRQEDQGLVAWGK